MAQPFISNEYLQEVDALCDKNVQVLCQRIAEKIKAALLTESASVIHSSAGQGCANGSLCHRSLYILDPLKGYGFLHYTNLLGKLRKQLSPLEIKTEIETDRDGEWEISWNMCTCQSPQ